MVSASAAVALLLGWAGAAPLLLGLLLLVRPSRLGRMAAVVHSVGLLLLLGLVGISFAQAGGEFVEVHFAELLREGEWAWEPVFLVDRLSLTYAALIAVVYVVIARFSLAAMVREPDAPRYWFLVTLFAAAVLGVALAGNLDVLYLGWELVGVTSVMLIAFFRRSVRSNVNSLGALVAYRVGDIFLLAAAVEIHQVFPDARFSNFIADSSLDGALPVGFLLLGATLAKSAQLPLSSWLHRAMEGPAASSGIFYGALSIHLGPYLLLRTSPLWMSHAPIRMAIGVVGVSTALYATLCGRTRPDAKTALAYATMAQVGIIFIEVSLGLHRLAVIHLVAHASMRTWQFLRSSSLIQDFQDNPYFREGVRLARKSGPERRLPTSVERWLYLAASRQFWLDGFLQAFVVRPFFSAFLALGRLEDTILGSDRERRRS